ncbi:hypothetical protein GCK32_001847 [Trichostrongylus colubriformis]|uniref:Uncharacterized protein n=1 Tax=Trichostrongylus colubriformis TaxID=6319 RepID=A0AAN8FU61_TRICO
MELMVLIFVLCLLVHAHGDNRNHPPALPERVGRVSLPQGPINERDRLDEIAMLVYGHNVSMIQYLYSVTRTEKSYRGKPVFQIFKQRYTSRSRRNYRLLINKVHEVFLNLAKSNWTRSQARKTLIEEWLKLSKDYRGYLRGDHPAFVVIDDMRAWNQKTTTLVTPKPGREASTQAEGPHGRLDEIAMLVYGHNVSRIQYLYSVTHTEKSYRGKPVFQIFEQRYADRGRRLRRNYRLLTKKVHEVFLNLAKSNWTRSQARKSMVKEWLQASADASDGIDKYAHPAFVKFCVQLIVIFFTAKKEFDEYLNKCSTCLPRLPWANQSDEKK